MDNSNVDCGRTVKPAQKRVVLTAEEWAQLMVAYREGATGRMLAAQWGVSAHTIYIYARRLGCAKTVRVDEPPALLADVLAAIDGAAPPIPACRVRRMHREHLWRLARRDAEAGFPVSAIAARYDMTVHAIRRRQRDEGWRRKDLTVEPLRALPDPAQVDVDKDGNVSSAWSRIAHAAQRPPLLLPSGRPWSTWLFQGGRGAGKTRAGAEWLAARAEKGGRFALVGPTLHDVREVMIDGPSGIRNLPGRAPPLYEPSRRRLVWPGSGAEAYAFSAEEPERLRGPQFAAAWADEFCTWKRGAYVLMLLRMGLRLGDDPKLAVTTTPKASEWMRVLRNEATCVVTQAPTAANAANLAPTFLDGLETLYRNTRWQAQELEGVMLDGDGALWRHEDLVAARGRAPDAFERVVVAVDPPAGQDGAACGIVAAGRLGDRAFVLADRTVAGLSPLGWAGAAAQAARDFGAGEIVAEANQGGDMVRTTLALAAPPCPVRLVRAHESKRTRALPVAALYEQRRVVHAGAFPALEEELMALGGPGDEEGRRDRADALVWAVAELLLRPRPDPRILPGW